jgi:BirA family biotin operon repressor/biotin-[acetyl-CoA-carboxylase] ligase
LEARLKWPNDLLFDGRKVAGILADSEARGNLVTSIHLGIGVNVNNDPRSEIPGSDSLSGILGRPVSRKILLDDFLRELERALGALEASELLNAWKARSSTVGKRVRVVMPREVVVGRAVGLDETGCLLVETGDGAPRRIYYGDCYESEAPGELKLYE